MNRIHRASLVPPQTAGFSLVETLVSFALLGLTAATVLSLLVRSGLNNLEARRAVALVEMAWSSIEGVAGAGDPAQVWCPSAAAWREGLRRRAAAVPPRRPVGLRARAGRAGGVSRNPRGDSGSDRTAGRSRRRGTDDVPGHPPPAMRAAASLPKTTEGGASLIETLVAFGLTVAVSAFALSLFGLHQHLARAQLDDSALQQAQQAAHRELRRGLRAAGRGGIARQSPGQEARPDLAAFVEKDVAAGHPVGGLTAAEGTDVLVVRGVMNGPLYWVEDVDVDPTVARGWVEVLAETPGGVHQPLAMLQDAGAAGDDALLLVSGVAPVHAVVPITEVAASGRGRGRRLRVHFHTDASRGPVAGAYLGMSSGGAWPGGPMRVVERVGVLEEWRFYIRPPDPRSGHGPQLAMARLYPGTGIAWRRRNSNLLQPIADDLIDLDVTVEQTVGGGVFLASVVTTARAGEPAAAALRVERTTSSFVRLRNLP